MTKIVIIGSISMDLVMETERIPEEGETVFGTKFSSVPGGKGANQAVAVGRLANEQDKIIMLGLVGEDQFGTVVLKNLEQNGVNIDNVGTVPESTGIAQITLFNNDNRIIYCPGANGKVTPENWKKEWHEILDADLVILQNEIPHTANLNIAKYCKENGIKVLYNPAPARSTDTEMLELVDYITPNETECKELFASENIEEVVKEYPNKLICTLGSKGVLYFDNEKIQKIPAIKAKVVDTTGAGDTFNGAFGFALTKGFNIKEALKFAILSAHLSIQKFGAQGGMPTIKELKESEFYEKKWNIK